MEWSGSEKEVDATLLKRSRGGAHHASDTIGATSIILNPRCDHASHRSWSWDQSGRQKKTSSCRMKHDDIGPIHPRSPRGLIPERMASRSALPHDREA